MIILGIGPYSLTLTRFGARPSQYPRQVIEFVTITQSARGASIRRNTAFRAKHIWNIEARLTQANYKILKRMFAYYETNKGPWTIDDLIDDFEETSPRSRALATGALAPDDDGTTVTYQAKFNAEPTQGITRTEGNAEESIVTLQFTETEVIPA